MGYVPGRRVLMPGSGWVLAAGATGWAPVERGWGDVGAWWGAAVLKMVFGVEVGGGLGVRLVRARVRAVPVRGKAQVSSCGAQNELAPADVDAEDEALMTIGGWEVKLALAQ
ncbi:hypothetical protein B0H11DRAFT_1918504 [Mycena galericulata]|nr:hypothetical protein B0H11DRAFT_1918504 [Mycena galericulata]